MLIKNKKIHLINLNDADICIINTCSVTQKADTKSKYFIRKASNTKTITLIVVIGCYSQLNEINENKIGIILGTKYKNKLSSLIKEYNGDKIIKIDTLSEKDCFEEFNNPLNFTSTRAFIKIQDGCNFMCSYCLIPQARGKQRSLHHNKVISLIYLLISKQYKEIILSGINVSGYYDGEWNFYQLLKTINDISGDFRIRISSTEPFQINESIIDLITSNKHRWCQHFHICIQSANDEVLKGMKRNYSVKNFIKLCQYIKSKNRLSSITTDYMVGFPNETSEMFLNSIDNLKQIEFSDMHIFPFSKRENTLASSMINVVMNQEKTRRFKLINNLKKSFKVTYLNNFINHIVNVLFEQSQDCNFQSGHSEYFFTVKVKTSINLTNELLKVKITSLIDEQLFGVLV